VSRVGGGAAPCAVVAGDNARFTGSWGATVGGIDTGEDCGARHPVVAVWGDSGHTRAATTLADVLAFMSRGAGGVAAAGRDPGTAVRGAGTGGELLLSVITVGVSIPVAKPELLEVHASLAGAARGITRTTAS